MLEDSTRTGRILFEIRISTPPSLGRDPILTGCAELKRLRDHSINGWDRAHSPSLRRFSTFEWLDQSGCKQSRGYVMMGAENRNWLETGSIVRLFRPKSQAL
jgi:hypothetical protein